MNALDQYLDLYDNHRLNIETSSEPVLNARRQTAREALGARHLPAMGEPGYDKTSVDDMYAPDYGLNIDRLPMPADVAATFRCDVPNLSTLLAVVVNDTFTPTATLEKNLPDGVAVMSLAKAARLYPDEVAKYYGKTADPDKTEVALNTLLAQDGVYIRIAKGVRLDKPLQIVNISAAPVPMMSVRRLLIVAEENSDAHILLCDHSRGETPYLNAQVIEAVTHEDANLSIYDLEETSAATSRNSLLYADQHAGSQLTVNCSTLLNGTTRNEFHIRTLGDRTRTSLNGMAIGSGPQHIDNLSEIVHSCHHGHSSQLFKYVLDNSSRGAFEGGIEVKDGATGTEAYQSNKNILAHADARMHTRPQLLIYNDDVKCSHGASTGQLDENALFYMQTRGIPRDEARKMLMQAFMTDVIDTISLDAVRDRLRHLTEKRFDGSLGACASCSAKPNK